MLLLIAIFGAHAFATDLSGYWIMRVPTGDGNFRETVFQWNESAGTLTGTAHLAWGTLKILDGKVTGQNLRFALEFGDPPVRENYAGIIKGEEIQLRWGAAGRTTQTGTAVRTTEAAIAPPTKFPLPILRTLPDNGLARTPPMGWNSWNHFRGKIDDATVRAITDAMVANGMRDAGYVYVNIDDTWEGARDSAGNIQANSKFPDMKSLADYAHSKGMMVGIYSSPVPKTCAGYEGSYGHEDQDARAFAAWGIDYVKYDWCSAGKIYTDDEMQAVFQRMGEALQASGRPMVYSLSNGGRAEVWKWGAAAGANLWRTTDDIRDTWASLSRIGFSQNGLEKYAKWGHWNDPDMLEIGNGGMTGTEYKTHMTLWAMLAAPLLAGNDVRSISAEALGILTNKEVIAVDQDSLGKQGSRLMKNGELEVWTKPLSDGSTAVAWFNRANHAAAVAFNLHDIGFKGKLEARDLWSHRVVDAAKPEMTISVEPHGCVLLRVTPVR